MKICTRTEYGIRVLVTLARADDDGPCLRLTAIAQREKLPHAYLEQLVGDLRRAGLVTATRGQSGGYRLARPAAEIAMTDAVRALEGPLLEMPCAGADDLEPCDRPQPLQRPRGLPARATIPAPPASARPTSPRSPRRAGGPPYPPDVRRAHLRSHSAMTTQEARNA